jgi:hypothetical protein
MHPNVLDALAADWIQYYQHLDDPSTPSLFPRYDDVHALVHGDDPETAIDFIRAVLARNDNSDKWGTVIENLAAGPLEDVLVYHGPVIIEVVESYARQNPAFRHLLGGVWQRDMAPEVWERVQALVEERW